MLSNQPLGKLAGNIQIVNFITIMKVLESL